MPNYVEAIGKRFGRVVVLSQSVSVKRGLSSIRTWVCRCDCGTEVILATPVLRRKVASCGCFKKARLRELRLLPPGVSGFNALFSVYRKGARKKGLAFDLDAQVFRDLTGSPCFYCGDIPSREKKIPRGETSYTYNGIDRLDSSLGYVSGNVVSCCTRCNFFKGDMHVDLFLSLVEKIHRHTRRSG